jgi:SagB-type dehydrogenase family enzyme
MEQALWERLLLPESRDGELYELFHENSKTSRYQEMPSNDEVAARMLRTLESLPYDLYPAIELPSSLTPLQLSLGEAILNRATTRAMDPIPLALRDLATILHFAYGVTRDNTGTEWPRPFRTVPSGGALYPLEIYFYTGRVESLPAGLYHYNPSANRLRQLFEGDLAAQIADGLVQPDLAGSSSVIFFITAVFERSTFKYGDRGYRFTLLEAGHVAQNINLTAIGLGLGSTNIGGFFDRQIDALLGLDGVTHSTIYLVAVGKPKQTTEYSSSAFRH